MAGVLVDGLDEHSDVAWLLRAFLFKKFFSYKTHFINTEIVIEEHMAALGRALDLDLMDPPQSANFVKAIEGLPVDGADRPMQRRALEFLARDEKDIVGTPREFKELVDVLSDLTRLVHRYGAGIDTMLFAYPALVARKTEEGVVFDEFVTFKSFIDKDVHDIAKKYVPSKDRVRLEEILREELPRLGFMPPYPHQIDAISTERLALTVLLIRMKQHGDRKMGNIAGNILRAYGRGSSRNFFDPSNATNLDAAFFNIWDRSPSTRFFDSLPEWVAKFCGHDPFSNKWDRALRSRLGRMRDSKGNLPVFRTMEGDTLRVGIFD